MPIAGGAVQGGRLITWGDGLIEWSLPELQPRTLDPGTFTAGCPFDGGWILEESGRLVWWREGRRQTVDTEAAAVDLAPAEIFGRIGFLCVHRGMQVRFYQGPAEPAPRWPYREIYSFYTASEQGGLLVQDVDDDGRPDLICGNYWIQAPAALDLPWRLFAINLFHEHPVSASARVAWWRGKLVWLESKRPDARAVLFTRPADVRRLWTAQTLEIQPPLQFPRAVIAWESEVWIGENNGPRSRIVAYPSMRLVRRGAPVIALLAWRDRVIGIGPSGPVLL